MNSHTSIITIIFIVSVVLSCLQLECSENYITIKPNYLKPISHNIFLEKSLYEIPEYLGWKKFWKRNYTQIDPQLSSVYNPPTHNHLLKPFKFDSL